LLSQHKWYAYLFASICNDSKHIDIVLCIETVSHNGGHSCMTILVGHRTQSKPKTQSEEALDEYPPTVTVKDWHVAGMLATSSSDHDGAHPI
jgi:hypothetical protein